MSEEIKEIKEVKKKKLVYEMPKLVKLNGKAGAGDCNDGSGDFSCDIGNSAEAFCGTGNTASSFCDTGTSAGTLCNTGSGGPPPAP